MHAGDIEAEIERRITGTTGETDEGRNERVSIEPYVQTTGERWRLSDCLTPQHTPEMIAHLAFTVDVGGSAARSDRQDGPIPAVTSASVRLEYRIRPNRQRADLRLARRAQEDAARSLVSSPWDRATCLLLGLDAPQLVAGGEYVLLPIRLEVHHDLLE